MTTSTVALYRPQRTPSIAFPLVLIALGIAFLLANVGALRGVTWDEVFRLWPVLVILAGIDLLLRPRSFAAAALVEIAIVAAAFVYLMSGATLGPATLSYAVDVPRGAATDLNLTVNYGAGALALSGGGTQLVSVRSTSEDVSRAVSQTASSATVSVTKSDNVLVAGMPDGRWNVTVPSDVSTSMTLNLGAGDFDIDLSAMRVSRATVNAGASDLELTLPVPRGDVPIAISTGASSVGIVVPAGVAYRVNATGVLNSVSGSMRSADYDTAGDRVTITLTAAMSSLTIR